jgi:hypothetical protein
MAHLSSNNGWNIIIQWRFKKHHDEWMRPTQHSGITWGLCVYGTVYRLVEFLHIIRSQWSLQSTILQNLQHYFEQISRDEIFGKDFWRIFSYVKFKKKLNVRRRSWLEWYFSSVSLSLSNLCFSCLSFVSFSAALRRPERTIKHYRGGNEESHFHSVRRIK